VKINRQIKIYISYFDIIFLSTLYIINVDIYQTSIYRSIVQMVWDRKRCSQTNHAIFFHNYTDMFLHYLHTHYRINATKDPKNALK